MAENLIGKLVPHQGCVITPVLVTLESRLPAADEPSSAPAEE